MIEGCFPCDCYRNIEEKFDHSHLIFRCANLRLSIRFTLFIFSGVFWLRECFLSEDLFFCHWGFLAHPSVLRYGYK